MSLIYIPSPYVKISNKFIHGLIQILPVSFDQI